jgi:hypothetical protein
MNAVGIVSRPTLVRDPEPPAHEVVFQLTRICPPIFKKYNVRVIDGLLLRIIE